MSKSHRYHGPQDRLHAAQSPSATPEQLRELAGSPFAFVRAAVAGNPSTPPDVLDSLLPLSIDSFNDVEIAFAVVRNPSTDRRTRKRGPLLRRFSEDLIGANQDDLHALINGADAAGASKATLSLGTAQLVVDVGDGYAHLIDEQGDTRIALEVLKAWVSNVAAVSPRLRDRIRADFGAASLSEVLWALGWLRSFEQPSERLPAAAILFARGDWNRLLEFVNLGRIDPRDALIAGGLQHENWRDRLDAALA